MSFGALAHTFHNELNYLKMKLFEEGNSARDSGPSFKVPAFLSRIMCEEGASDFLNLSG